MTAALLLLLEGLVLLVLCVDLSRGFQTLPVWARLALTLLAAAGTMSLAAPGARRRFRSGAPLALLAAAAVLLGALGLTEALLARRIEAGWESGSRTRLEERARLLQEDFARFLDQILRPVEDLPGQVADPRSAFETLSRARRRSRLPQDRYGLSLYRADGSLLAWAGNSGPVPRDLIDGAGPAATYRIAGGEASPRLWAVRAPAPDGARWVGEFLFRFPAATRRGDEGGLRLDFLPRWRRVAPAHVHVGGGSDDMARFFLRQGDRYWGRVGREGVTTLSFPLREPGGGTLAVVTLKDRRAAREVARWRRGLRQAGSAATAAALLLAWLLWIARGGARGERTRLLAGSAVLWAARVILLALGDPTGPDRLPIFDITLYASSSLGGLLRSPADLLLTAAACLAQAWLLRTFLGRLQPPGETRRRLRFRIASGAALALLAAGGGLALHRFLDRLVLDARFDVGRVTADPPVGPRLALQVSLFLLAAAFALLLWGFADLSLRSRVRTSEGPVGPPPLEGALRRIPAVLRLAAGILLLTLLYVPFLHHAYDRLRQAFFEDDLAPRVLHQQEKRRQILQDSLAMAQEPDFAALAGFAEEGDEDGRRGAAYRLWTETPLAEMGLASSLQIFDPQGSLLSRFALNLAPMLESPFAAAREAAGGDPVEVPPRPRATVKKPVLFGARWVRAAPRPPLLLVMTLVDDYDNLPMLGTETIYLQMFGAPALSRTNPEILRFEPMVAVFGTHLARLYESAGEIPPPDPEATEALKRSAFVWTTDDVGDNPARIVYFRGPGEIFALAYSHPGRLEALADYLRLFLLNGGLTVTLLALGAAARRAARRDFHPGPLVTSFYGRLMAVFLLSALVPLLALAYFVTRFTARELSRELTAHGLESLQMARRVAEDYLTVSAPEEEPTLDDDVVYWLSRVVRQDINVYRDADLLATSTRELYTSGLLDARLDGEAYRSLYLEREPFRLVEERVGGFEYLTLSAPMRIDRAGTTGVISIPLAAQRRAVARKAEEVEDAILISTCFTVLLLAGVGYLVARRVSEPITLLARAARRVAQGDLDVRVSATASDETAILVDAFNRMAASLREQREDLRRRKDYIEKIVTSAPTGVVSIDAAGRIMTINPAAQALLCGRPGSPTPDENLDDCLRREPALAPLRAALRSALEAGTERAAEVVLARGEAERRVRAVFLPFAPEEGSVPGRIILLEDVTEIVRSGRLAAWAEMARRIAHEIKNPLTPIQLSVEHVRRLWKARDARFDRVLADCLENILRQVRTLKEIATEFSAYARLPQLRPQPTAVRAILDDALGPYATAPPPGITLRIAAPDGLPPVLADRAVIARALVNLVENALEAMPEGGTLSVGADLEDGPDGRARVRLEVRDTGTGIDPAVLPRLFEPYFSTKSGGTGLGLAIARRAVEEHGGGIDLRSRPGEGTVVTLTLPVAGRPANGERR